MPRRGAERIDVEKLARWYSFQAPFYSLRRDRSNQALVGRVAALLDTGVPAKAVLDAGCGTGLFCVGLAKLRRDWDFQGLDASAGMLEVAGKRAARYGLDNLELHQGDVYDLPFSQARFDALLAGGLLPNLNDPERALREFARVLKAGGQLVVIEFDRSSMTASLRFNFRLMILGYRLISSLFRRFRFAESWDLEATTVDPERLEQQLARAGFHQRARVRQDHQLIYDLVRE